MKFPKPNPFETEDAVFAELKARGATHARIAFSGGNDEGGTDAIELVAGATVLSRLPEYPPYEWDNGGPVLTGSIDEPETRDGLLGNALAEPIYARYRSFAGEFEVEGTVSWDVASKTVSCAAQERSYDVDDVEW